MIKVSYHFHDMNIARRIFIQDENVKANESVKPKADKLNPNHIGAQMPGSVTEVKTSGETVTSGQALLKNEAMKMETTIQAPFDGVVKQVTVQSGEAIETGDLLIEIEKNLWIKFSKMIYKIIQYVLLNQRSTQMN